MEKKNDSGKRVLVELSGFEGKKARYNDHKRKMMVSSSTSTDDLSPMMYNSWSQTCESDWLLPPTQFNNNFNAKERNEYLTKFRQMEDQLELQYQKMENNNKVYANEREELLSKFREMEEKLRNQSETISKIRSSTHTATSQSVNYRIIADSTSSGIIDQVIEVIEPIEVEIAEETVEGDYDEDDDDDKGRLHICMQNASHHEDDESTDAVITIPFHVSPEEEQTKENVQPEQTANCSYTLKKENKPKPQQYSAKSKPKTKLNTSNQSKESSTTEHDDMPDVANIVVSIGPNNTRIPAKVYDTMNWNTASLATRKLLSAIFDRQTLATHTMTGKPSPAFRDHKKPDKAMLDPKIISDIIFAVKRKCNASEKEVRNAITTKCADENKMYKLQQQKQTEKRASILKENNNVR